MHACVHLFGTNHPLYMLYVYILKSDIFRQHRSHALDSTIFFYCLWFQYWALLLSVRTRLTAIPTPFLPRLYLLVYFIWILHGYVIPMWYWVPEPFPSKSAYPEFKSISMCFIVNSRLGVAKDVVLPHVGLRDNRISNVYPRPSFWLDSALGNKLVSVGRILTGTSDIFGLRKQ